VINQQQRGSNQHFVKVWSICLPSSGKEIKTVE